MSNASDQKPKKRDRGEYQREPTQERNGDVTQDIEVVGERRGGELGPGDVGHGSAGNSEGGSAAGRRRQRSDNPDADAAARDEAKAEAKAAAAEQMCIDLGEAIDGCTRAMNLYKEFLAGNLSYEEATNNLVIIGTAAVGVTPEGKRLPKVVQDAIEEGEGFEWGEEGVHVLRLFWAALNPDDAVLLRTKATVEIERQVHLIEILRRKQKQRGCQTIYMPGYAP